MVSESPLNQLMMRYEIPLGQEGFVPLVPMVMLAGADGEFAASEVALVDAVAKSAYGISSEDLRSSFDPVVAMLIDETRESLEADDLQALIDRFVFAVKACATLFPDEKRRARHEIAMLEIVRRSDRDVRSQFAGNVHELMRRYYLIMPSIMVARAKRPLGFADLDEHFLLLVPAYLVGAADGHYSSREEAKIIKSAEKHGLFPAHLVPQIRETVKLVRQQFQESPDQAMVQAYGFAITAYLLTLEYDVILETVAKVRQICEDVAKVDGRLFDRVSDDERRVLSAIFDTITV